MSDKITQFTALDSPEDDDVLPIVDVHDTTMATSGTTKKITVADLLAALLPLAGGTVSGNLEVDGTLTTSQSTLDDGSGNVAIGGNFTRDMNITGDGSSGILSDTPRVSWGVEVGGNNNAHGEINSPVNGVAYLDFTTVGTDYKMRVAWYDALGKFVLISETATVFQIDGSGNTTIDGALVTGDNTLDDGGGNAAFGGNVTVQSGQFIANNASSAQMRIGQKSNTEIVWSYNVDQNNSDAIDDASLGAWKFSIEAASDYTGAHFQYAPPGGSWDGVTVFALDGNGNLTIGTGTAPDSNPPAGSATLFVDSSGNLCCRTQNGNVRTIAEV